MRIAVVTASPLFAEGGHTVLARSLVTALRDAGHDANLLITPQNRFGRNVSSYLATWLTDVGMTWDQQKVDQVISLRFPSYAVRHPRHVSWLFHRMREYYDLWDAFIGPMARRHKVKEHVRRWAIHRADGYLLTRNVTKLYVISGTVQERLRRIGGIPSSVLYPPPPQRAYRCETYGDEFFAVSRLTPLKRLDLLVRAMAEPEARGLRCTIAGDGDEAGQLKGLVAQLGVQDRVTLAGPISTDDLVGRLATCRAVVFPVFNEDYGLVTVEAFTSRKAVVTCADSGGPAELVRDGANGFVCDPTPASLARAMRQLADDRALAERLGAAGAETAAGITWPRTVDQLLLK
jgi:glycosyltransferase involved in cell wall biosynthesis